MRWATSVPGIAVDLQALLGTPKVTLFPQTVSVDADYRASIEVQRFESLTGEAAVLDAVWTVRRTTDEQSKTGRSTVREPVRDKSYPALVAAHSRAAARLSQDIADAVRSLDGAAALPGGWSSGSPSSWTSSPAPPRSSPR